MGRTVYSQNTVISNGMLQKEITEIIWLSKRNVYGKDNGE
jgi:hypothetical protein